MSKFRRFLAAKLFTEDHPNDIMMTMDSNPEVMRICYRNGFAKNKSYMTYLEAAAVTNTSAFNSAFNNSDIVYFNEAKYFTGITGTISFTAPRLREFAFLPNASGYSIGGKFPVCYRYDIGVCIRLSLRNGAETIINPYIAEIVVSPNNTVWAVTNGHLGKGQIIYRKSDGAILWTTPDYKGGVIIYPKKYQQTNRGSVSYSYARFRGHTIVANNFYSGNASFNNGGYYVQKIISFKNTSYYNSSSFPSNIGSRVPKSIVKEFIVSADDPKDFMADTNYTTNFLNPNVCNFQLRRVNFGITIYNEKALFPLKGLYADEYFMTKEECAEVTTLDDRFRNSDVEEFTELQYFTSLENIDNAFYGCSKLKTFTLPSHITTIGNNAFANCTSLESIVIPEGITTIGNNAFANCTSLESITIPSTVTYIGDNAFRGCVNISIISMKPTTAPTLGENVWGDNESNYVGSNVNGSKYLCVKSYFIGYSTEKWDMLNYLNFLKYSVLYIQSDSSYNTPLNTQIVVSNTDLIYIAFKVDDNQPKEYSQVFGWRHTGVWSLSYHCCVEVKEYGKKINIGFGKPLNTYIINNEGVESYFIDGVNKIILRNGIKLNSSLCDLTFKNAYTNNNSKYPVCVFGYNKLGLEVAPISMKLFEFWIKDKNGNYKIHLLPHVDDDGRACLKDYVTELYFYGTNGYDFEYGESYDIIRN